MCGILGYISKDKLSLENGLTSMEHRGPDAQGIYEYDNLRMGHRRLSIIDLNEGANQPFLIDDNSIVFNGEIYNFNKLKSILEKEGCLFKTQSDTEVLLNWLISRGIEGVKDLDGMFAFAWFNESTGNLYLVRDSLGIKPLYVYHNNGNLIFSSEIKSIFSVFPESKKIDTSCFAEYLLNGFIYEPETGFENIRKVAQGGYELYNSNTELLQKSNYWDLTKVEKKKCNDFLIHNEIKESINSHLVADVPIGLFFSGGVDSSIILTQTLDKILPVTIKSSKEEYKEAGMTSDYDYAKKIAEILNLKLDAISIEEVRNDEVFLGLVEEVALGNEELMADFTFQSSKKLSQEVREKGYTVMISGMGADEIFAGYSRYKLVKYDHIYGLFRPIIGFVGKRNKWLAKKVERFKNYFEANDFAMKYTSLVGFFSEKEVAMLLADKKGIEKYKAKVQALLEPVNKLSKLKKSLYLDFFGFLSHNFSVADKSSMKGGIELRVPLATKKLYELAWNMKDNDLISFSNFKKPLKSFLLNYIPKEIINRKKAGFNPPLDLAIYNLGKEKLYSVYEKNGLFNILNEEYITNIINKHFEKKINNTYKLYQLLHFSFWYKNFSIE